MRTCALLLTLSLCLATHAALAHDYKAGAITIADPWSRETPKGATVAAGYMKISNGGTTADRLIGGSSDVATSFQIHEMKMENGMAQMRPLKDGLPIEPGKTVELKPGSYHLMLVGLKQPLKTGDRVKATLRFEKAGPVEVDLDVLVMGASPTGEHAKDSMQMH
jgi:copper(I)-binding protein